MHGDGREVALAQQFVELSGAKSALDEDDDLVELQLVKQLVELTVLLALLKRNVVLLETVQRQLRILIDVVLRGVLHKLPADGFDLIRQSCREHHDLLLLGSSPEDLLDIATHV